MIFAKHTDVGSQVRVVAAELLVRRLRCAIALFVLLSQSGNFIPSSRKLASLIFTKLIELGSQIAVLALQPLVRRLRCAIALREFLSRANKLRTSDRKFAFMRCFG